MVDSAKLVERLTQERDKTVQFFRQLTPANWELLLYTEGAEWRVRDVLAHIVSAESGIRRLIADIVQGNPGAPEDFDLDGYNQRKVRQLQDQPVDELLDRFLALREKTIRLVESLSREDLQRQGRHPFLGVAPVEDIIKLMYRHVQIHLRDIRRAITPT
jgi:hypothetical protein